jgi:hypothetical protein
LKSKDGAAVQLSVDRIVMMQAHSFLLGGFPMLLRTLENRRVYCLFNFSAGRQLVTWFLFKEHGTVLRHLLDYWREQEYSVGHDHEYMALEPYQFAILEPI